MNDVVIRAEGLGKKYLIGHQAEGERYTALRDVLARGARGLARSAADMLCGRQLVAGDEIEEFWALKDVSFEIRRGEVVGIIGRNGAGKSTLLKILSRITEPTKGRVEIRGRLASLLEVGTGFHPELTGRENIYLNGAVLGMTRAEIRKKFDEIVAFAEVEKFLDTAVKRYSSGMYVRLAFAVAAHLEPEILVIDEVLAVGDAEFQKKCLGKMQDVAGGGRTVLFVSHNMAAIRTLCTKCLYLQSGRAVLHGRVNDTIARYTNDSQKLPMAKRFDDAPESPVTFHELSIAYESAEAPGPISNERSFNVRVEYSCTRQFDLLHVNLHLLDSSGLIVLTTASQPTKHDAACYNATCQFPPDLLNTGVYSLTVQLIEAGGNELISKRECIGFEIVDTRPRAGGWMGREPGVIAPVFPWSREEAQFVHNGTGENVTTI